MMKEIQKLFDFNNIGGKLKKLATWSCWLGIVVLWLACAVTFCFCIATDRTSYFWIPLVVAVFGPFLLWFANWGLYAFGDLVESVTQRREMSSEEKPVANEE